MARSALILVDLQNDYLPDGDWPVDGMEAAVQSARGLLTRARDTGLPVFHIRHEATSPTAPFFRPGTKGADIVADLSPRADEPVIHKHRPNSFYETDLKTRLHDAEVTHVILAGAMTQMCIDATARAARDFGFGVTVAQDACAARAINWNGVTVPASQVQATILSALKMSYARVLPTGEIITAMA